MHGLRNLLKRHSNIVTAIVSAIAALVTEFTAAWLEMTIGQTPSRLLQLSAIALLLIALFSLLAMKLREQRMTLVPTHKRPPRMVGLIALVGQGDPRKQSARAAIDYHLSGDEPALQICWLIASQGLHGSYPTAIELKEMYEDRCRIEIHTIADPFDLHEVYSLVRQIYDEQVPQAGLSPSQVITDFTGGTAPMSAGAVLACREYHVPAQYMSGGTAEIESMPIMVSFTPGE